MYLGIDCGTQGTKALLVNRDGLALGRGYSSHALIERSSGAREQEPQWWIDALRLAVRQAMAGAPSTDVLAMAVSGQQHGLVVLDEDKRVIRPAKLWNDTETAPQNAKLIELLGGKSACSEKFGIVPLTGYTVSKLLWLRENEPENFSRIRHILLPHEYLNFWLTGKMYAEYGDASGTAFFDVRSRSWIREVLDVIDEGTGHLFNALPEFLTTEDRVGNVLPEVAAVLGISSNCLVAVGGGDNMMGAIGTGNVKEGIVTLSLGTSSTVYSYRSEPVLDPGGRIAPFCSSSGGWLPLVCTMNATNVVTQTLQVLGKAVGDIDGALDATQPGAEGLIFVPYLNGERTPDLPNARGSIVGISSNNFTNANLIRSVVEGVSFGILNGLDLILGGRSAERILVIGGGARSASWRQLLADATGAVIQVPVEEEAGCLGAAMQAVYAHVHSLGRTISFDELADQFVKVDAAKSALPRGELHRSYREAKSRYDQAVAALYEAS
jgi:xylulokinase